MKPLFAVALLASCLSCGRTPEPPGEATVVRTGFSIRDDRIGIGAIVRVDGQETLRDIVLDVRFRIGDDVVGAERDTLPYCPPATDCPWGQLIFGDRVTKEWWSIDDVDVRVVGSESVAGPHARTVEEVPTVVRDGAVEVTPDGRAGTAYTIAFDGDVPVAGYSFFTTLGERDRLTYSSRIFPRLDGDRVETVLYVGDAPDRE
jgi:hypothetical protein